MLRRLRAQTERVERSAARVVRDLRVFAGAIGDGAMTTLATVLPMGTPVAPANAVIAWNVKPSVQQTAFCTFGTYHTRRLQERPT